MHRHAYAGRKLSRKADPRRALLRNQVTSLVLYETLTTTEAKAKTIAPIFEDLVTTAKHKDLASRRKLAAYLTSASAVRKMVEKLTPAFEDRSSGYTRVIKAGWRRGDRAPLAVVALVLPEAKSKPEATKVESKTESKSDSKTKAVAKPAPVKTEPEAKS